MCITLAILSKARTALGRHGLCLLYAYYGSTCWGRHDLVGVLAGQPIRLLSRVLDATGSSSNSSGAAPAFGWDVEVWHERLLGGAAAGQGTARAIVSK